MSALQIAEVHAGVPAVFDTRNESEALRITKVGAIGNDIDTCNTAEEAFERVKPLLDRLRDDTKAAANVVAKEYDALPKLEKAAFAEKVTAEYGWSQERVRTFAQIGREFPSKQELICRSSSCAKIDDLDPAHMEQIIRVDDDLLKKAAKQGMFDRPVSVSQIKHLRKTGQLPTQKPQPKTGIAKAQDDLDKAVQKLKGAAVNLHSLVRFMQEHSATQAGGLDAFRLLSSIEGIAAVISDFDSETRTRAVEIIQGTRKRGLPLPKFGVRPARGTLK